MPLLEALDNKGNPTGRKKFHSEKEWNYLRRLKNRAWRLVTTDSPMISRANPTPVKQENALDDFPTETWRQHDWVEQQTDLSKLEKAIQLDIKRGVRQAIKERMELLNKVTNKN